VGYRLLYVADSSRTLAPDSVAPVVGRDASDASRGVQAPEAPRVLPVRLWYPAAAAARGRAPMRYGEYLDVRPEGGGPTPAVAQALRERTLGLVQFTARRYARALGGAVVTSDTAGLVARLLATARPVVRAAPVASGRFPVVVFAGGAYHSVDENVSLWEHLASRGYVVAAFPSVGVDGADLPADDAGLETMTRDVETVIAFLARVPGADRRRLAAGGFSFGGAAGLVAAARNRWVDAVFGLDPSFIGRSHTDRVLRAPLFLPARVDVPVLEMHRADTTVDLRVLESLVRAPRYSVELTGVDHVDFNSYALLYRPLLPAGSGVGYPERNASVVARAAAYVGMVESLTDFLDAHVARTTDPAVLPARLADDARRWADAPGGRVRTRVWPAGAPPTRERGR
jgi:dienelactone hydrolase